jgi:hypothetical protein
MIRTWIVIYLSVGATFGFILARPLWLAVLSGRGWPSDWAELQPMIMPLLVATGHGVLRGYAWLPSVIYHLATHQLTFDQWLTAGAW